MCGIFLLVFCLVGLGFVVVGWGFFCCGFVLFYLVCVFL